MQKNLFRYSLTGFIFVSIIGTLCHFIYKWSGYSIAAAFFCPVNESTWEHLKLLFFPYLIWTVIEYKLLKKDNSELDGILLSKLIGSVAGMAAIVIFFYTYTGAIGKSIDILNILSFFIGVGVSFLIDSLLIRQNKLRFDNSAIAGFTAIAAVFIIFTFAPPLIPLFKDPITSVYGI